MEKDNLNFTASSDDLSVEAILAEYEAENGIINPGVKIPKEEPSRPLTMNAYESDAIGTAEVNSRPANYEHTAAPYPKGKTPLSDLLRKLEDERAAPPASEPSPERSGLFENEASSTMSVDEIMLMADIGENPNVKSPSVGIDDIFRRSEKPSDDHLRSEENVKAKDVKHFPTRAVEYEDNSLTTPTIEDDSKFIEHYPPTNNSTREIEKSATCQLQETETPYNSAHTDTPFVNESETPLPTETTAEAETEPASPTMRQIFSENSISSPTSALFEDRTASQASPGDEYTSSAEIDDNAGGANYADNGDYESDAYEDERSSSDKPDAREKLLTPIIAIMAYSAAKREKRRAEAQARRDAMPKDELPELAPDKAAMLYAQQAASLKLRCLFATALTVILVYLSYGLPAAGLLGKSPSILAIVCIIFELTVMLVGLDIFTNGMTSLMHGKPGAESLISVSAIASVIDAVYIAITGNLVLGLPFCGVSALSMTFALWGSKISCDSFAISFTAAASAEDPTVILSEPGIDEEGCALAKTKRPITGFVRTSESADVFENAYKLFSPILIIGSLILSLFCYLASSSCSSFIHTFGASISICASLSSFLGFAMPFSVTAKRLARSRVAIAGYGGSAELGRIRRIVITDSDVFPARTISIADISIAEGLSAQRVISYTSSMISAAGMGTAPAFTQLMRKNGCVMQKVEDFACHEGGGIIARVSGDHVYVGTAAFMRLMGVRIPKSATSKTAVYTAINDTLAGYFSMNYTAVASVQRALVTLLSGNNDPVFAIRDFNITPLLLKQKFRLPSAIYDFPSFADRYRMSSPEYEEKGTVCAMYSRGGLGAVAGLSKRGRKLYVALRICSVLSVLGSVIGMVLILALCWSGAYDSASCGNIMTYMLLWLVPLFVISYGLRN